MNKSDVLALSMLAFASHRLESVLAVLESLDTFVLSSVCGDKYASSIEQSYHLVGVCLESVLKQIDSFE